MYRLVPYIFLALLLPSCKKEKVTQADLTISVEYLANDKNLLFDTLLYDHPAGYKFSVSRIQYYISDLVLLPENGSGIRRSEVHYLDAGVPGKNSFVIPALPIGRFNGLSFLLGLDSATNQTGSLPATVDNLNMAWPDLMGGGYHFIKMEGLYKDSTGIHGYSVHLGKTGFAVAILLKPRAFEIRGGSNTMVLQMNIDEWFRNPTLYDFNTDGNYSMGDSMAMKKLANNANDIFNP